MYWVQIIHFLTWPLFLFVTYRLIIYYLKKLDRKLAEDGELE